MKQTTSVARRGEVLDPTDHPVIGAYLEDQIVGVASYDISGEECEVVTIEAIVRGRGVGRALMDGIRSCSSSGCLRLWLVTTNDNIPAMSFYRQ
jgi:ribosomal protein S18 acetylase RimI-like enzyme